MRRRRKKGADEKLLSYEEYVVNPPEQNKGRWASWFGNENPIHLELGAGRASFSLTHAQRHPNRNYVAIDLKEEVMLPGVEKSFDLGLENISFVWMNIQQIQSVFAPGEVDLIYLNFSDPWPKTRHAKRRLTHRNFLNLYKGILKETGWIHFKTDSDILFEFTLNECAQLGLKMENICLDLHGRAQEEPIVLTDYEKKYITQNKTIYKMQFSLQKL